VRGSDNTGAIFGLPPSNPLPVRTARGDMPHYKRETAAWSTVKLDKGPVVENFALRAGKGVVLPLCMVPKTLPLCGENPPKSRFEPCGTLPSST